MFGFCVFEKKKETYPVAQADSLRWVRTEARRRLFVGLGVEAMIY
jgi:hypothetical protein